MVAPQGKSAFVFYVFCTAALTRLLCASDGEVGDRESIHQLSPCACEIGDTIVDLSPLGNQNNTPRCVYYISSAVSGIFISSAFTFPHRRRLAFKSAPSCVVCVCVRVRVCLCALERALRMYVCVCVRASV